MRKGTDFLKKFYLHIVSDLPLWYNMDITTREEHAMMILLFGVLSDEQRALVERIFREHRGRFLRISFKIVKSEETAEDVVSTAFVKIMPVNCEIKEI